MKSLLFLIVLIFALPAVFAAEADIPASEGAPPAEALMDGSFIDAAEKEDPELLRERIRIRLEGPFSEFIDEFFHLTKTGGNIFHALAGARTNQEELSKILNELARVFSVGFNADTADTTAAPRELALAGTKILFRADIEDTSLFQAVRTGKPERVNKEMKNIFEDGPARSALSYLHARAGSTALLPHRRDRESRKRFSAIISNLSETRSLNRIISAPFPYNKTDYNGLSPRQIAEKSANLPAFDALRIAEDRAESIIFAAGMFAGGIGAALSIINFFPDTVFPIILIGSLMASVLSSGAASECYNSFKKKKIMRAADRLKTGAFKDSRLPAP